MTDWQSDRHVFWLRQVVGQMNAGLEQKADPLEVPMGEMDRVSILVALDSFVGEGSVLAPGPDSTASHHEEDSLDGKLRAVENTHA